MVLAPNRRSMKRRVSHPQVFWANGLDFRMNAITSSRFLPVRGSMVFDMQIRLPARRRVEGQPMMSAASEIALMRPKITTPIVPR